MLCSNRAGQAILRYLVTRSGHSATSDTLKVLFWPEEEPEFSSTQTPPRYKCLALLFQS